MTFVDLALVVIGLAVAGSAKGLAGIELRGRMSAERGTACERCIATGH